MFFKSPMKSFFLLSLSLLLSGRLEGASLETYVIKLIEPEKMESKMDVVLVLLSHDGEVLKVRPKQGESLKRLKKAAEKKQALEIEYTSHDQFDRIESLIEVDSDMPPLVRGLYENQVQPREGTRPSSPQPQTHPQSQGIDPERAFQYLSRKNLLEGSQCYHRAYVWAHDLWQKRGIASQKVFLFFTPKYIYEYGYDWWFHVAPFVTHRGNQIVLDPTYTREPLWIHNWTSVFVSNDAFCPTVQEYRRYERHHSDQYCYLRKVSMYYYHPKRVKNADKRNDPVKSWDRRALRYSESQARSY